MLAGRIVIDDEVDIKIRGHRTIDVIQKGYEFMMPVTRLATLVRGVPKGLGDLDLFQICDGARQYQQRSKAVFLGQAVDETLNRVLVRRQFFIEGRGDQLETPGAEKRVDEMVHFMFSNPYAEQEARLA